VFPGWIEVAAIFGAGVALGAAGVEAWFASRRYRQVEEQQRDDLVPYVGAFGISVTEAEGEPIRDDRPGRIPAMKRRGWAKDPWRPAGVTVFELARVMATSMRIAGGSFREPRAGSVRDE
jgi:hypothetical protein